MPETMNPVDTIRQHIEIVQGAGGPKAVIAGHRIRVIDVVFWHVRQGMSAEEIVDAYPTITLADVYAALAYYWDNRDEIERQIAADDEFIEEFRRTMGPSLLVTKLRRRLSELVVLRSVQLQN